MKILLSLLILLPLLFGFTEPPEVSITKPSGTVKYVDNDGSGCNNGNIDYDPATASCGSGSSTVYTSLENADGNVGAGNTLRLRAGTYNATIFNESGSSGSELVIDVYSGETVFIETGIPGSMRLSGNHIIVDGGRRRNLKISNSDPYNNPSMMLRIEGSYITIKWVHLIGPSGYCNHTNNTCIQFRNTANDNQPSNVNVYNCLLEDCSHKAMYISDCQTCVIQGNIIDHTGNNGIQLNPHQANTRIDRLEIKGNAICGCGDCTSGGGRADYDSGSSDMAGDGIYSQGTSAGEGIANIDIYNNLIWNNVQNGIQVDGNSMPTGPLNVYNNTSYGNGSWGIWFAGSVSDNQVTVRNNIFNSNTTGEENYNNVSVTTSNNNTSPSFVSSSDTSDDFLKISASDDGYDTNPPVTEGYFGNSRSFNAPDIGAHEYTGTGSNSGGDSDGTGGDSSGCFLSITQ